MSVINKSITNGDVIPRFETDLFTNGPRSRWSAFVIAVGDRPLPGRQAEYDAGYALRENVYIRQTGQLRPDDRDSSGLERDESDVRSISFGIAENLQPGIAGLSGYWRLLGKGPVAARALLMPVNRTARRDDLPVDRSAFDAPLPIEDFFPEIFSSDPAPDGSIEISRFIIRHPDLGQQSRLKKIAYKMITHHVNRDGLGPTYGVIEPPYFRDMRAMRLEVEQLASSRRVDRYNDWNLPIEVDTRSVELRMDREASYAADAERAVRNGVAFFGRTHRNGAGVVGFAAA